MRAAHPMRMQDYHDVFANAQKSNLSSIETIDKMQRIKANKAFRAQRRENRVAIKSTRKSYSSQRKLYKNNPNFLDTNIGDPATCIKAALYYIRDSMKTRVGDNVLRALFDKFFVHTELAQVSSLENLYYNIAKPNSTEQKAHSAFPAGTQKANRKKITLQNVLRYITYAVAVVGGQNTNTPKEYFMMCNASEEVYTHDEKTQIITIDKDPFSKTNLVVAINTDIALLRKYKSKAKGKLLAIDVMKRYISVMKRIGKKQDKNIDLFVATGLMYIAALTFSPSSPSFKQFVLPCFITISKTPTEIERICDFYKSTFPLYTDVKTRGTTGFTSTNILENYCNEIFESFAFMGDIFIAACTQQSEDKRINDELDMFSHFFSQLQNKRVDFSVWPYLYRTEVNDIDIKTTFARATFTVIMAMLPTKNKNNETFTETYGIKFDEGGDFMFLYTICDIAENATTLNTCLQSLLKNSCKEINSYDTYDQSKYKEQLERIRLKAACRRVLEVLVQKLEYKDNEIIEFSFALKNYIENDLKKPEPFVNASKAVLSTYISVSDMQKVQNFKAQMRGITLTPNGTSKTSFSFGPTCTI